MFFSFAYKSYTVLWVSPEDYRKCYPPISLQTIRGRKSVGRGALFVGYLCSGEGHCVVMMPNIRASGAQYPAVVFAVLWDKEAIHLVKKEPN